MNLNYTLLLQMDIMNNLRDSEENIISFFPLHLRINLRNDNRRSVTAYVNEMNKLLADLLEHCDCFTDNEFAEMVVDIVSVYNEHIQQERYRRNIGSYDGIYCNSSGLRCTSSEKISNAALQALEKALCSERYTYKLINTIPLIEYLTTKIKDMTMKAEKRKKKVETEDPVV